MPTIIDVSTVIQQAVRAAGGQIIRTGSKPWAEFHGSDAEQRAQQVFVAFIQEYGYRPTFAVPPLCDDEDFDYAVRLD